MKKIISVVQVMVLLTMASCAQLTGPYYLEQEKYDQGIAVLGEQLKENPEDASSAYYVGRYYLALEKQKQAQPYLQRAVKLDPENADYHFWLGVDYWALKDFKKERVAYGRALTLDPKHISANLYLGHSYLDKGKWAEALVQYDKVIKLDKYNPEALYNRADALKHLGQSSEEITAWKKFLKYYPDGILAMRATENLNLHGDFTYRNFILGKRNVTLKTMKFKTGSARLDVASKKSLHVLAAMLESNKKLSFHIVAYKKGDAALANKRAKSVRDYIMGGHPRLDSKRMELSWFGSDERIKRGGKTFSIDDSVQFITAVQ
ncbi:OmpA family protein [Maridesulfovibrio ferrireducens]|uniref:OmpA family protein n=1 Tax=Maridesulfovibrio ferrireducens TaxID=246191 RepID=A0A1G9F468_9BACT|nr:tetratricopeptide repeat protein [Maridesulfovibrio ferrireducens]SDK83157.1 OmpA family protein [Maridesulfovibrio ferrireducens]